MTDQRPKHAPLPTLVERNVPPPSGARAPRGGASLKSTCHLEDLVDRAYAYIDAASATNTRRAYAADWKHFSAWCRRLNLPPLPPDPEVVGLYITACASGSSESVGKPKAVSTIERRLSSIAWNYAQRGLTLDRLRAQWDEIERVQEQVKIKLLKGTESDILADGALDYSDAILEKFDIVIASIHSRHKMDSAQMTARLVRALELPIFKIWGHPRGRLLRSRPPFDCRMEEVLDAIAESRGAIEVNGDPRRLDLEPRWIREARARQIKFVVSTDAHSVSGLNYLRFGVAMARRGWLTRDEVLNTLSTEQFMRAVRP